MPQLSPMFGDMMFLFIIGFYTILMCNLSKKQPFVTPSAMKKSSKVSHRFFS